VDIHSNKYDLLMLSFVSAGKMTKLIFRFDGVGISFALFQNVPKLIQVTRNLEES